MESIKKYQIQKERILNNLKNDNPQEAIKLLFTYCEGINNKFLKKELLIQSASLERLLRAFRRDTIDWNLMSRKKNKIIESLIEIVEELEESLIFNQFKIENFSEHLDDEYKRYLVEKWFYIAEKNNYKIPENLGEIEIRIKIQIEHYDKLVLMREGKLKDDKRVLYETYPTPAKIPRKDIFSTLEELIR